MIEKKLRTTEGRLLVAIPTLLNELTLGQLMEMQEKPYLTDLEAISILSGVPVSELNTVCDVTEFQIFSEYILLLSHQIGLLYNRDEIPKKVTFYLDKPVTVNVINNLSVEPAGAFMAAREIIAEEIKEHIEKYGEEDWQETFKPSLKACCQVLGQYFFCRVTGKKYNEYQVEEFYAEVKKLKVTEALPIARHFFSCYPHLSRRKTNYLQRLLQLWRRRQEYRRLNALNTLIPSTL
ncbi:MAG: hypothetical protein EOP47_04565 [Sphingobacteriaceae bacterium]|nr:MAG: hypothetical protein EOP47_04565 [Sphingobacteriaceae bacterium]